MRILIGIFALLISTTASAVPIRYGFQNYILQDGATVQGFFVFDKALASTGGSVSFDALKNYSIVVSGGDTITFPVTTYDLSNSSQAVFDRNDGPGGIPVYAFGLANAPDLELRWTTPQDLPTNIGDTVALTTWGGLPFGLANQQCYDCFPQRQGVSGGLVVQAVESVPEPRTIALLLMALGVFACLGFRRSRALPIKAY